MINSQNPIARQRGLVVQELPDEVLVYDLDSNKAHCLNQSAAFIWRSCDGNSSVLDIAKKFESAGSGTVTEDFVWLAIDQLGENDLLEGPVAPRFEGQSRRQVLKTVGLASMVAIPVIASLVAPQNALGAVSCSCLSPANCLSTAVNCPSTVCNAAIGTCTGNPPLNIKVDEGEKPLEPRPRGDAPVKGDRSQTKSGR